MANPLDALQSVLGLQSRGDHAKAIPLLRAVLAENANHPDALHLLGLSLQAVGETAAAFAAIQKAIEAKPGEPLFHCNAGAVAVAGGEIGAGIAHYRRALELKPDYADACNNLGIALEKLGYFEHAEIALRRALELAPRSVSALVNLGNVLRSLGKDEEAADCYERAIDVAPSRAEAHNNLGNLLKARRQFDTAVASYDRALALQPHYAEAHFNRGLALAARGDPDAAAASIERAIAADPLPRYRLALAGLLPVVPTSRAEMEKWRQRFADGIATLGAAGETQPGTPLETPVMSFYLAYHGENDRDLMIALSRVFRQIFPVLQWTAPAAGTRIASADGRVRVGIFSAFLSDHAVAWTIRGLIERLARGRFDVTLYTLHRTESRVMPELRAAVARVVGVPYALARAREQIAAGRPDVLIYADIGMESLSYALAHARIAPVQCAIWGHPVTTGISTVDYYISNDVLEPEDADAHYSERLVRLGGVQTCYRRPDVEGLDRGALASLLPPGATTYLCPQSLFKIHPDMDRRLAEILRRDANGALVLFEGADAAITDRLRARWRMPFDGVMDRVHFLPRVSVRRFLELLAGADVLLDTWPFGGGNTSYQGFAAGIPIVTLPGRYMRGRGTLALYRHMQIDDCIADSPEAYVDIAVRLGTQPDFRRGIAERIRDRADVVFDDARVVADLERFLLRVAA